MGTGTLIDAVRDAMSGGDWRSLYELRRMVNGKSDYVVRKALLELREEERGGWRVLRKQERGLEFFRLLSPAADDARQESLFDLGAFE